MSLTMWRKEKGKGVMRLHHHRHNHSQFGMCGLAQKGTLSGSSMSPRGGSDSSSGSGSGRRSFVVIVLAVVVVAPRSARYFRQGCSLLQSGFSFEATISKVTSIVASATNITMLEKSL